MNTNILNAAQRASDRRAEMEVAIRAWHQGLPLTTEQKDLIHEAGVVSLAHDMRLPDE
ncbi:hypothetical protein HGG72_08170 [Ochrobactrum pecoris]|uniref:Uncharacterized protein n=2 Tax=Brucella TaxID=234 RepID=A0A7X6JAJ9_9HYPH|nr:MULTISPECIES: hypothetical protein [Brucella]MBB4092401.1 hypothetical protein [Brucella pecoris]NKW10004.1 hypothetical protein [Brucella tritici]NKW80315.1 hypothetical protein [Brucella pecoris]